MLYKFINIIALKCSLTSGRHLFWHLFLLLACSVYSSLNNPLSISVAQASPPHQETSHAQRTLSAKGKTLIKNLGELRFDQLGHPAVRWDSIPAVKAPRERPHQLLVVLVRFSDIDFERFKGEEKSNNKLSAYYQSLLFDSSYQRPNTLSHYFATQSYGLYHLQGRVLPPVTLDHPRAHYGRPKRPQGGSWRNDTDSEGLVEEVLGKVGHAYPDLKWSDFDQWDPNDVDGDGLYEEPDGYLDHLVLVYAGGAQSSCQGLYKLHNKLNPNVSTEVFQSLSPTELECADRIWPHRFKIQRREGEGPVVAGSTVALGGSPITSTLWARDYNMQSEYTEASTFIHEFGHSIGLPDIYARQTNNSTGPWELMSSTTSPSPQGLSAWSRIMLGWLHPTVINPPEAGGKAQLKTSLITLDTPPGQFEKHVAPAVAKTRRMIHEVDREVIQPAKNSKTGQSILSAGRALIGKIGEDIKQSETIQTASKVAKRGLAKTKRAIKEKVEADEDLKRAVKSSKRVLSVGINQFKESLEETKKSLDQLAPPRALLITLPPQPQEIDLVTLEPRHGRWALYSGQGNEMNRVMEIELDLTRLNIGAEVSLRMEAWWQIEAGWDFAYLEVKPLMTGSDWTRLVDRSRMIAKHGHDGPKSKPGFTGRSGDLDGDGKNESAAGCDPSVKLKHGEDKRSEHPCERSTWSDARFDLSPYVGQRLRVRLRYFTDPAAVEKGILIDNLRVQVKGQATPMWSEDFEGELSAEIRLDGFIKSNGRHAFEVPHFYIVEHRDPYAGSADPQNKAFRYDSSLGKGRPIFGYNLVKERVDAVRIKARPGALVWYVNGRYAWSENEPTQNGPGEGFLLAVDSNPNELRFPGLDRFYQGDSAKYNTRYDLSGEANQEALKLATLKTLCFVRTSWSYPRDLPRDLFYTCSGTRLPQLRVFGKTPMFVYEVINRLLPGEPRSSFIRASELYDFKSYKGKLKWGLRNRMVRGLHLYDAPFSSTTFEGGIEYLTVNKETLTSYQRISHPARASFDDTQSWLNPHLRFGGVKVPSYGLKLDFVDQKGGVEVTVSWRSVISNDQ